MPAKDGNQYIQNINHYKANVWLEGKKIEGNISEHPAFRGVMKSQADLYDLQFNKEYKDILTYKSPTTGNDVGISFLRPQKKEDLEKRRLMFQSWAKLHKGMMGRSPDYMNTVVMVLHAAADLFAEEDPSCADHLRKYYEYCRENDITLTHTFINPQVDRSSLGVIDDQNIAVTMIDKNKDGIVIEGARLLATQGAISDEILVFPTRTPFFLGDENPHAFAFAIPNNTPGLKYICRESFDYNKSSFDHPLGSRFEEMDTIVVFDKVTVPWDRVFICGNTELANKVFVESNFYPHVAHQVLSKNVVKTEFVLGIIQLLVETINISEYQHVQEKVAEVIVALETLKAFLITSEIQAKEDKWGTMMPDPNPLTAACSYFPKIYPRFSEIIQLLGASGLVTIPSEKDFNSELRGDLEKYLQGANCDGYEKVRLFRLAWDLSMSAFGGRQTLYERFFFGDPVRMASGVYKGYNLQPHVDSVKEFLNKEQ
jgi:4-hydroxyphenylacetate 3-monooxygenase